MSKVASYLKGLPLSVDEIALKSRLSSDRVRAFLDGEDPSLADLRALARGLKVPLRAFTSDESQTSELGLLFRQTTASRPDRGVESAASFVQAAIELLPPRHGAPDWLSSFRFEQETYEEAARLADEFRERFTPKPDEPLTDLPRIITDLGVILGRLETSRFEGASVIVDGYPFVFVSPRFSGRMLFTLAHEIGHLITHHKSPSRRSVSFDLAGQIGNVTRYKSHSEFFVNAFASVLLMPARGIGIALQAIRKALGIESPAIGDVEILYISRIYGVSFEVAARRCEDLELLPPGGAKSLADYLRDNFGGPEKRALALKLPPRPTIEIPRVSNNLLDVAAEKVKQGDVSIGWVTDRLNCTINEVYGSRVSAEGPRGHHH